MTARRRHFRIDPAEIDRALLLHTNPQSKSRSRAKNTGGNRFAISATYWIDAAEPFRWESAL
jgi:hypothetical protein